MRAWRFHGFGDMRLHELPDPECGPHDALVRVRVVQPSVTEAVLAFGGETFGIEDVRAHLREPPAALFGHEYCAEVLEVGGEVTGLQPGTRVADVASLPCLACPLCREGREDDCRRGPHVGWDLPGCLSDVAVVPARGLVARARRGRRPGGSLPAARGRRRRRRRGRAARAAARASR